MEAQHDERQRDEQFFQHGDQERLRDPRHGADVFDLGNLVHQIDRVGTFLTVPVTLMDGVDTHETGLAFRHRPLAHADPRRGRLGVPPDGALGPVGLGAPQVVEVRTGQGRQPLEPPVAEHLEGTPHHRAGGRAAHLVADLVDLGQQADVSRGVDPLEGPSAVGPAAVGDLPRLPVLGDEPGHLGAGQPRRLAEVLAYRALARPPDPAVPDAYQRAPDELVGVVPFLWKVVDLLVAFQEGIDLINGVYAFGL